MTPPCIGIVGAGAFGTALAVTLARDGRNVVLWTRDEARAQNIRYLRENRDKLPGIILPEKVTVSAEIKDVRAAEALLITLPMQDIRAFLAGEGKSLDGLALVACCKGIDLQTLTGPSTILAASAPNSPRAVLTGPSFAADIARGLPTALTLACASDRQGQGLQRLLSTQTLRLYLTDDVTGAELGGAVKNVIAIAAGIAIGAGLGNSARAALMTRGYAEMMRLALELGARAETLAGLSGFGDLVLTCTSDQSRNFRYGLALGREEKFDPTLTVEGAATAKAVSDLAKRRGIELPITAMVAALINEEIDLSSAIQTLLSRPLKKE